MTESEIKEIVSMTVDDLVNKKLIAVDDLDLRYAFMGMKLKQHYKKCESAKLKQGLELVENDPYFDILPLYFKQNRTITAISIELNRDRATIARNKKRLMLELYDICYSE